MPEIASPNSNTTRDGTFRGAYAKVEDGDGQIRPTAPTREKGRSPNPGRIDRLSHRPSAISIRCRQTGEARVTPPFDARHHLAACSSVFLFRGPLGRPRSIGHGHRHRALG